MEIMLMFLLEKVLESLLTILMENLLTFLDIESLIPVIELITVIFSLLTEKQKNEQTEKE